MCLLYWKYHHTAILIVQSGAYIEYARINEIFHYFSLIMENIYWLLSNLIDSWKRTNQKFLMEVEQNQMNPETSKP